MINPKYEAGEKREFTVAPENISDFASKISNGDDKKNISSVGTSSNGKVTVQYSNSGRQSIYPAYSKREADKIVQLLRGSKEGNQISAISISSDFTVRVTWR